MTWKIFVLIVITSQLLKTLLLVNKTVLSSFLIALTNQDLVCLTTVSCHCNKLRENYNAS